MADPKAVEQLILSRVKLYINHPIPNQLFLDIFPIFRDPVATELVISNLESHIRNTHDLTKISSIVCLESRGFFFAPILASRLSLPCVPVRKTGKMPGDKVTITYSKEYGPDGFEMKTDAFEGIDAPGKKAILVDDLLGKGGSIKASTELVGKLGVEVAEAVFIFDIAAPGYEEALKEKLGDMKRYAMVTLTEENMGPIVNMKN